MHSPRVETDKSYAALACFIANRVTGAEREKSRIRSHMNVLCDIAGPMSRNPEITRPRAGCGANTRASSCAMRFTCIMGLSEQRSVHRERFRQITELVQAMRRVTIASRYRVRAGQRISEDPARAC